MAPSNKRNSTSATSQQKSTLHIPLLNVDIHYAFDISTLLIVDGLFFLCCVGMWYAFTEAEMPLAMYLGPTNSFKLNATIRPFMKMGMSWLGATDMFWSMLLLVLGFYTNAHSLDGYASRAQQAQLTVPVALCHTMATTGIGFFAVSGAAFAVGAQIPSMILSVGAHAVFAVLWWMIILKTYKYKSSTDFHDRSLEGLKMAFTYDKQAAPFLASFAYLLSWASFMGNYPLFLYIMFDHPKLSHTFDPVTHYSHFAYGILHSIQGLTPSRAELDEISLTFMVVAAGSAMFGLLILISVLFMLRLTKYDIQLRYWLHTALTCGHLAQLSVLTLWWVRPTVFGQPNIIEQTHAIVWRWLPIVLSNVVLAGMHYSMRTSQQSSTGGSQPAARTTRSRSKKDT